MANGATAQFTNTAQAKQMPNLVTLVPGSAAYAELPQFFATKTLPFRRTIRRRELHQIVPLAETTIYELERRGEFPRRFNFGPPRCVVWDLGEVESWLESRKQASRADPGARTRGPDVRQRKQRPVKT